MSNPMKYIRDLEAAGFERAQAEAQVQMVLDAIEGDLVTKSDFAIFREHMDRRFAEILNESNSRFAEVDHRFIEVTQQMRELELRIVVKLGLAACSLTTIAIAVLGWLIKSR